MSRLISLSIPLILLSMMLVACGGSDAPLPTLRPTVDSGNPEPTVDPNIGSGFDPNLGNDDTNETPIPTPTRESGATVGGDNESGARGTGFMAQVTGGSIANINDGGQYACNLTGHRIASGASSAPNITFTLPTSNAIGTHTLADSNTVSVLVSLASVDDSYNQITGGTLTLDQTPEEAGEFVRGSFDFTARNDAGTEIGIRGDFEFETANTSYC